MLRPGDSGYSSAVETYDPRRDHREPAAVVRVTSEADTVAVLAFARRYGLGVRPVGVTDLEPELGQRTGSDTCPGERPGDATRLCCITQAEQPVARAGRAVAVEDVADAGCASHRHDCHPLGRQIMAIATGQRLDRHPVTLALDQHRRRPHRTSLANASRGARAVSEDARNPCATAAPTFRNSLMPP